MTHVVQYMIHQVFMAIPFIREKDAESTFQSSLINTDKNEFPHHHIYQGFQRMQIMGSVCEERRQTNRNMATEEEIQDISVARDQFLQIMKMFGTRNIFQWNLCL